MNECAAQRGFLMFRSCGNAAVGECSNCGRPMCSEHLAPNGECLDCAARGGAMAGAPLGSALWAYGFRDHFYRRTHYRPLGLDPADPYYDDYDVRSFDSRARHAALGDDERETGFGDS